jgi:hypothetical protein
VTGQAIQWGNPRPPRPGALPTAAQIAGMTRTQLFDLVAPAVEHYQRAPRRLTDRQEAEYQAWWRLFRTYFEPGACVGAALLYLETGDNAFWNGTPVPMEGA